VTIFAQQQHQSRAPGPSSDLGVYPRRSAAPRAEGLPPALRDRVQPAFGFDFANIRLHIGGEADTAARGLHAAAFTYGRDIYFREHRFEPHTVAGQWLIAHELAHVIQQQQRGVSASGGASAGLERHATQAAHLAIAGRTVPPAPSGAGLGVQCETEEELRAQLAAVQASINAERVRIAGVESSAPKVPTWELGTSGTFERRDWAGIRAGETKAYYNLLERRDVLQLRVNYPEHQFLEQVSINRVVTKDGQVFEIPERIADWALVKDDEVILGDKKSTGAIKSGIKGGIPKDRPVTAADLQGSFRTTTGRFTKGGNPVTRTKFGDQVMKERYAIMRATALGGKIVVAGTGAGGAKVERQVPPAGLRISRLNPYGQLPDKLLDEPAAAPPRPAPSTASTPPGTGSSAATGSTTRTVPAGTTAARANAPQDESVDVPPTRAPAAGGGGITRAEVAAIGLDIGQIVLVQILNHYLEQSYAEIRGQATREYIRDAVADAYPEMRQAINARRTEIAATQARGREATLKVIVKVGFSDNTESDPFTGTTGTTISNVPSTAHVVDVQAVLEGETAKPYDKSTSFVGDLFRGMIGYRSRYYHLSFPIGGTDTRVRHQQETARKIEAAIGRRGSFEDLIVQSRLGGQDPAALREYVDYQLETALPSPGGKPIGRADVSAEYWRQMRALIDGPLTDIVAQARIKSVPLDVLKQRVGAESDIGKQIDAPLLDKEAVAKQEHLWTLGGTDAEIAQQRASVEALRAELKEKQQLLSTLGTTDARTPEEIAAKEPPHPPWSRIHSLKQDIAAVRERLWVEEKLLRSIDK
jgi:hypothetical protein